MICLQAPGRTEATSVDKLRLQMVQLEDVVSHMAETQASFASNNTGACLYLDSRRWYGLRKGLPPSSMCDHYR